MLLQKVKRTVSPYVTPPPNPVNNCDALGLNTGKYSTPYRLLVRWTTSIDILPDNVNVIITIPTFVFVVKAD